MDERQEADLDMWLGKIQNASRRNDYKLMKQYATVLLNFIKECEKEKRLQEK